MGVLRRVQQDARQRLDRRSAPENTYGASFAKLPGLRFATGTNEPARFIDFQTYIDSFLDLSKCNLDGYTENAIHTANGWVNCFLDRLRSDHIGATRSMPSSCTRRPGGDQNRSAFILRELTYGHQRDTDPGKGVICFAISVKNMGNAGVAHIHSGRIEVNADWAAPKAIVTLKLNDAPAGSGFLGLRLSDICCQDCTAMPDDVVIIATQRIPLALRASSSRTAASRGRRRSLSARGRRTGRESGSRNGVLAVEGLQILAPQQIQDDGYLTFGRPAAVAAAPGLGGLSGRPLGSLRGPRDRLLAAGHTNSPSFKSVSKKIVGGEYAHRCSRTQH